MSDRFKNSYIVFLLIVIIVLTWLLITMNHGRYCKPILKDKKTAPPGINRTNRDSINSKNVIMEHKLLLTELSCTAKENGETGKEAKALLSMLKAYFANQEKFVVPALSLLPNLMHSNNELIGKNNTVVNDNTKIEIKNLLKQQHALVISLYNLMNCANRENKPEYINFTKKMIRNLQRDEKEIIPAALLIRKCGMCN